MMSNSRKIYTKTGDGGSTSLYNGSRVSKASDKIKLLGRLDEVNSYLGVALQFTGSLDMLNELIVELQSHIMDISAEVALATNIKPANQPMIDFLEETIDELGRQLKPLEGFILPGGGKAASFLHLCRTSCRTAECEAVEDGEISKFVKIYLNRLSDLLFTMARILSAKEQLYVKNKFHAD